MRFHLPLLQITLIGLFSMFCLYPSFVHAGQKYSVTPLVIDVDAEARDITTKKIVVTNLGEQQITIYPTVNNISLNAGGVIEAFLSPAESDRTQSLASWIEIKRLGMDLKAGESREFDVTFRINPNPVPGTYHAFIGFGNGRNRDEAEQQVEEGQAPGTIVTLTIEDKKVEALSLSGFTVQRFVTKADNQGASFTFRNPGDEILVPKGEIILYDSKGKEVAALPVNDENIAISPGGEHTFQAALPAQGFGKYKAFLSVEYGARQRASVHDTNFYYVFPTKTILILLGIVFLFVCIVAWYVHKKYFDTDIDDSDRLTFHVRESQSDAKEHDVILKKQ
jgi:hypothetical protein